MIAKYDLLVIGGGSGGLIAATYGSRLGARVVLIERDRIGGDCLWTGCVPSKALIAAASERSALTRATRFDAHSTRVGDLDFQAVMDSVRRAQQRVGQHDSAEHLMSLGVEVIFGSPSFIDAHTVTVDGRDITARKVIIATGSHPGVSDIDGLDSCGALDNESVWQLQALPRRLAVLGGGPIGVELGQAFARLGSSVTIIEAADRLLPRDDRDVSQVVGQVLQDDGIVVHCDTKAIRIERCGDAQLVITQSRGGANSFEADELLVALGRTPRTDGLGLTRVGIAHSEHGIVVDNYLRTTAKGVYAIGDVNGLQPFTHAAADQARIVLRNALTPSRRKVRITEIPRVTFTDPEVAHLGHTEHEARALGSDVETFRADYADLDRAICEDRTDGFAKLVVERSGRLLGAQIVGRGAGETIALCALIMQRAGNVSELTQATLPYPTRSEIVQQAALKYFDAHMHDSTSVRTLRNLLALRRRITR